MADVSVNLSEEAKRYKKIYYPKGGEFGMVSKLFNDLFIEHCKKLETIEFFEEEINDSKDIIEQQTRRQEEANVKIQLIQNRELNKIKENWKIICEKREDMKEFLLETIEIKDKINLEDRLNLFNSTFKQRTKLDFFKKLIKYIENDK